MNDINIYAISGLGVDKRAFQYLELEKEIKVLNWLEPQKNESLSNYSGRLMQSIDCSKPFILIGLSFGGVIAMEISKKLKPQKTILISSIINRKELTFCYKLIGKTKTLKLIPTSIFIPPKTLLVYLFGATNKKLLYEIINETDKKFAKWAITQLLKWEKDYSFNHIIRIHGTKDNLLPLKYKNIKYPIINGGHFMIVDRAGEISEILNKELK